jgi:hypothetical protein
MIKVQPHDGLFRVLDDDDSLFLASVLTGGPWNPSHQHGGAVAGLLTRAMHKMKSPVPMRLSRITIEMFRGVPVSELRIETRVLRAGRRIQSVEANLFDTRTETQVARSTGLRIRRETSLANLATSEPIDPLLGEPPDHIPPRPMMEGFGNPDGFSNAAEFAGDDEPENGGPSNLWARLKCRLMQNEPLEPIVQLATLADFASGTGNDLDYSKYSSINPDLSIHVIREPRSDWIGIRGISRRADDGIGQSLATLHDLEGPIATVQACLLLDKR